MMTSEELLDLIDKLDSKIEELDEQIDNQQLKVNSSDGDIKERRVAQLIEFKNEKYRINNIIKQHSHLQKVETIGDAYMVVGDIYRNTYNHQLVIKEMILLGIDYISEIKKIATPDNIPLQLRIGITMGNVSIGILGNEIPRLCVVGNTVNVASRLQSTADPDTIQMSRHIYEQLPEITFEEEIDVTKKENVFLKNLGTINTFVVTPLSVDNDNP